MSNETGEEKVIPIEEPKSVQAQASEWLARLDGDKPTAQDLEAFKQWVNQDTAHIEAFEEVAAAWGELNILTHLPVMLERSRQQQAPKPQRSFSYAMAAATLVIALLISLQQGLFTTQQQSLWTAVGEQKTITLPDNSVVQLNTGSRLRFDYSGTTRAIYLYEGEAHFTVASNPDRPFEVYAGVGLVRAVGTAFSVTLLGSSDEVNVMVTEGVVEIEPEIQPRLTANQSPPDKSAAAIKHPRIAAGKEATFNPAKVKVIQTVAQEELRRRLAWQEGLLIFSGEPLQEVIAEVSRYTDTRIVIKSDQAKQLRIGGQFQIGDTRAIFNALEKGFNLKADYVTNSLVYLSFDNKKNN